MPQHFVSDVVNICNLHFKISLIHLVPQAVYNFPICFLKLNRWVNYDEDKTENSNWQKSNISYDLAMWFIYEQ